MSFPAKGRTGDLVKITMLVALFGGNALAEEPLGTWATELVADGMTAPNLVTHAGDGSGRLFVVDQNGLIRIIDADGNLLEQPFLDISDQLVPLGAFGPGSFDERGLLGLAFAPDYSVSGQFYVYYSAPRADPDPITFEIGDTIPDLVTFEDGIIGTQGIPELYCTLSQAFEIPAGTTGVVQFHEDVISASFQLVHKAGAAPGMLDVILHDESISETIVSPLATFPCDPANRFTVTAPGFGSSINRLELHAGAGVGLTLFFDDLELEQFNHDTRVSRFVVSQADPNLADADSESIIFQHPEPQFNHNSGTIAFGPDDGMLYISFGDGGNGNDVGPHHTPDIGNGQDITNLWGSILRIDVSGADDLPEDPLRNYAIPNDNIFADIPGCADGCDEIWAYGLRNPFRCAFDSGGDHAFICGDAGQNLIEEVSAVGAGENMGWPIREGSQCFDMEAPMTPPDRCPKTGALGEPLINPIMEYGHVDMDGPFGQVVIGGNIYRGSTFSMQGAMFFGDFSKPPFGGPPDGSLFLGQEVSPGNWVRTQPFISNGVDGRLGRFVNGFGEGEDGEIYVCTNITGTPFEDTGAVLRIVPSKGDCDGDADVDLTDFGAFQLCFTGPGGGPVDADCACSDFDNDGDVDLGDFGGFQLAFTGSL